MEKKKMADSEAKKKWIKENATNVAIRLMLKTDSDIIDHLAKYPSKSGEIKRLLRIALEVERKNKEEK